MSAPASFNAGYGPGLNPVGSVGDVTDLAAVPGLLAGRMVIVASEDTPGGGGVFKYFAASQGTDDGIDYIDANDGGQWVRITAF